MLRILFFTVLIIAICLLLLSVRILLKKNGRFPKTHVGSSAAMRKRGIGCNQSQDFEARLHNPHAISERTK